MKKILFLVTLSTWGGGAQRYVYDLALACAQNYHVTVAAGEGDGTLLDRMAAQGISVHKFSLLKRNIHPYYDLLALAQLKKFFVENKFDIVHLNSSKVGILGSVAANSANVPHIIYTAHGFVFNEPLSYLRRMMYRMLERRTSRFKDHIICVSEFDRQSALHYHIAEPKKLITIHNGIDESTIEFMTQEHARASLNLDPLWTIYGTIANFFPAKGLPNLINAFADMDPDSKTHCVIIGEGNDRHLLESLITTRGMSKNIHLLGHKDNSTQYLKAFNYFVLSSVKEGLPYGILEALATRLPIVSTNVGGIPEIIQEDDSHILVPPHNIHALTHALQKIRSSKEVRDQRPPSLSSMIDATLNVYSL